MVPCFYVSGPVVRPYLWQLGTVAEDADLRKPGSRESKSAVADSLFLFHSGPQSTDGGTQFRTGLLPLLNPLWNATKAYLELGFTNVLGASQSSQVDN
jgi:hypothetical protein